MTDSCQSFTATKLKQAIRFRGEEPLSNYELVLYTLLQSALGEREAFRGHAKDSRSLLAVCAALLQLFPECDPPTVTAINNYFQQSRQRKNSEKFSTHFVGVTFRVKSKPYQKNIIRWFLACSLPALLRTIKFKNFCRALLMRFDLLRPKLTAVIPEETT